MPSHHTEPIDLSPSRWPPGALKRYMHLTLTRGQSQPVPEARSGMVTGTSGALAIHVGVEALRQGGSAVDAVMVTAMAQVALAARCWVSHAGKLLLTCYDAATGEVRCLNAGFDVPRGETDPLSIPFLGTPSGRTALVPGVMAGVQAAHDRYGRLPFRAIETVRP